MNTSITPDADRAFIVRRGRVSRRHQTGRRELYPRHGAVPGPAGLDLAELFGRRAEVVLEIGTGMGDATADMAAADPDRDFLAVEVHAPGVANLLWHIEERGLTNLRVHDGDAVTLLTEALPPACLAAVHVFFPDPWPKARHHKRRLIRPDRVALLRDRLRPGGVLRTATDWQDYAEQMLEVLTADPQLVNRHSGFAPRWTGRPVTKFERRGREAGRRIFDLEFHRVVA